MVVQQLVMILVFFLGSAKIDEKCFFEAFYEMYGESFDQNNIDELQEKSHAGKVVMELLNRFGCLKGLPQSNQMSLFEM